MKRLFWLLMPWIAAILSSCGGSGDSVNTPTGQPPGLSTVQLPPPEPLPVLITGTAVNANVHSFPDSSYPSNGGFFSGPTAAGANSRALVYVGTDGTPNPGATVVVNGISLPFDSASKSYLGDLAIAAGAMVDLSVTVGSNAYTASMNQFASFQTVTAPPMVSSASAASALSVTWTDPTPVSPVPPNGFPALNVWVVDAGTGAHVWPATPEDVTGNSFSIPAGSLTVGDRMIGMSASTCGPIAGAAGRSFLCVGGVRAVPVTVSQ